MIENISFFVMDKAWMESQKRSGCVFSAHSIWSVVYAVITDMEMLHHDTCAIIFLEGSLNTF